MDEQTQVQLVDTEKFMPVYSQLSQNKLEVDVARAYEAQVRKDVRDAQDRADQIVNALTSRSQPPNFAVARSALKLLATGPAVVVGHWQKFISAIAEVLPPLAEGETDDVKVVDEAAEAVELKDLRAMFGRLGSILPLVSARELRDLREGFAMLGEAIGAEFGKRGMPFDRDGSAAALERLGRELEVANDVDNPIPKDFAFSSQGVMRLRALVDQHRGEVEMLNRQIAEMKEDTAADNAVNADMQAELNGLKQQLAALTTERDSARSEVVSAHQTRDEMAEAATKLEQSLDAEKKRSADLAAEVDALKKKSSKTK